MSEEEAVGATVEASTKPIVDPNLAEISHNCQSAKILVSLLLPYRVVWNACERQNALVRFKLNRLEDHNLGLLGQTKQFRRRHKLQRPKR